LIAKAIGKIAAQESTPLGGGGKSNSHHYV
jgi:hypothetical protein